MKTSNQPSTFLSTLCVVLLLLLWGYVRLIVFPNVVAPLSFVLPLMLCIWTRRVWQLLTMVVAFIVIAFVKYYYVLPANVAEVQGRGALMGITLTNIFVGAAVVYATLRLRLKLEQQNDLLTLQNETLAEQQAELEAQSEELAQQNEELKNQSEELTQQNEHIEAQAEELHRQNEELKDTSERLGRREELLAGLLDAARAADDGKAALDAVCSHTLNSLGVPAEAVALLVLSDGLLQIAAQYSGSGVPLSPNVWPRKGSIAGIVCEQKKTAYISDLREERELAAPFGSDGPVKSIIATPIVTAGSASGILVAVSSHVSDWTQDQFQLLEWTAAQCALVLESNRLQNAMQERAREIEKAGRAKDDFLAMLSHELRTPLTPVLATASELEHDPRLPTDVRDDLAMIKRNVDIQSRLVDDLLDLTKIARGKLEMNENLIDLRCLLKEVVAIVRPEAQVKHQTILCEEPNDGAFWVRGDPARLHQVFWNLLKNAVRYSPNGTTIRVSRPSLDAAAKFLSVSISDPGVGISAADLERIFRPFEQVAGVGKHRHGDSGLGLGLAIAKAVVEIHGGTIRAESDGIGKGSTFTVVLPAAEAPSATTAPNRQPQVKPAGAPLRILLVEDHRDTGRVVAKLLRASGYHVEHAQTAAEARRLFEGTWFDLLISDLGLPDESGIELMRQLRALRPDLLGICVSGYGMENDLNACREVGFSEHLTKPIEMNRLRLAISRTGATRSEDEPLLEQQA